MRNSQQIRDDIIRGAEKAAAAHPDCMIHQRASDVLVAVRAGKALWEEENNVIESKNRRVVDPEPVRAVGVAESGVERDKVSEFCKPKAPGYLRGMKHRRR